ncbi:hypothetical protein [Phaeocystidibacter luteus]|uniref:Uncharacterized protein n=1 Tax=Phaeocystidibacter luteus TaxID=911197 RepID=A0A6N6RIF2_9FLAO|nr:hypothetical protein [Phaeocystidibacter luteus]KAB2810209.1 hypothetical protein F8C67_08220 [Phaeocystidibacter luteus]
MKKTLTILGLIFSIASFGQGEDYTRTLLDLKWGSGKLDAYLQFEPLKTFHLAGGRVRVWDTVYNTDSSKSVIIESIVLVDESNQTYIELLYANDKLYAKNLNWFYHGHDVEGVTGRYRRLNGAAIGDAWMVQVNRGKVIGEETHHETGKKTHYEAPHGTHEAFFIETGYETVEDLYDEMDGDQVVNGFYAYGLIVNTEKCDLDDSFIVPKPEIYRMPLHLIDRYLRYQE